MIIKTQKNIKRKNINNRKLKEIKNTILEKDNLRLENSENGITLVALVITIIIIIILSTVTINMAFGDNGLIRQAELARDLTANSTKYEEDSTANLVAYMNEVMGEDSTISDPKIPTDGSFSEEKGVNTPKLGANMKLVVFDDETDTWVEDETNSGYSYVDTLVPGNENGSEWANAEVTVDEITSYFVWIPRYAYKITYYTSEDKTEISSTPTTYGTIDVKFINGTGKTATDGTECKYASENPTADDYIVHPAFTDEEENGGWDSELAGIWIGKYEASLANKADGSNIVTNDEGTGNILLSNNTDKTVVTKPGYSSWRYITIGNMYTNALAYDTNLASHMLKNSEWGAVAYLTESKYGRNGTEIEFSDEGYITGGGTDNAYATTNQEQSSTGNVYGIYDLRGGASEYVASYYNGSSSLSNGSSFAYNGGDSTKYATAYTGTSASSAYKYGDATYETSGWHSDLADFVNSNYPFFNRGGYYNDSASSTGVFFFNYGISSAYSGNSFRLALAM